MMFGQSKIYIPQHKSGGIDQRKKESLNELFKSWMSKWTIKNVNWKIRHNQQSERGSVKENPQRKGIFEWNRQLIS